MVFKPLHGIQGENMTDEDYIKELTTQNNSLQAQVWQLRHGLETAKHQGRCMACELRNAPAE